MTKDTWNIEIIVSGDVQFSSQLNTEEIDSILKVAKEYRDNTDIGFFNELKDKFYVDDFSGYIGEFFDDSYTDEERVKAITPFLRDLHRIANEHMY